MSEPSPAHLVRLAKALFSISYAVTALLNTVVVSAVCFENDMTSIFHMASSVVGRNSILSYPHYNNQDKTLTPLRQSVLKNPAEMSFS